VLLSGDTKQYGYSYDFSPDGNFTVFGTITNADNASDYDVAVWFYGSMADGTVFLASHTTVNVPAATDMFYAVGSDGKGRQYGWTRPGTATFSLTVQSFSDRLWVYWGRQNEDEKLRNIDISGIEIVDQDDLTGHTVDQGPMSDTVALYSNGKYNFGNWSLYGWVTNR
jgi:hypothetical protein